MSKRITKISYGVRSINSFLQHTSIIDSSSFSDSFEGINFLAPFRRSSIFSFFQRLYVRTEMPSASQALKTLAPLSFASAISSRARDLSSRSIFRPRPPASILSLFFKRVECGHFCKGFFFSSQFLLPFLVFFFQFLLV